MHTERPRQIVTLEAMKRRLMLALLGALLVLSAVAPVTAGATSGKVIHVDDDAAAGGNGSGRSPYNNVADALAHARTTSEGVVIDVAPGDYAIDRSLVIDRPLDLRGSNVTTEDAEGWPTGGVAPGTETRLFGTASLGTQPLVLVGRSDGVVVSDVEIRGLLFQGRPGVIEVQLIRVQGFVLQDNVFRAPAFLGMQSVASSGLVADNHFSGVSTGAILNGGYPASPSRVRFTGNRSVHNTLGGLLLNGASFEIPELGDELDAVVRDNDLSSNTATPNFSFGLRLFILRRDPSAQSSGNIRALVKDNRVVGNELGMSIDAGFPYRRVGTTCDPRVFSGTIDLDLVDNVLTDSRLAPALVTFTRNAAALDPALRSQWQYLHDATFTITDPHGTLTDAWIDHPESDPFTGPCAGDATNEPLDNTLRYKGIDLPNGRNF